MDWKAFASPTAIDEVTYGYQWDERLVMRNDSGDGSLFTLPEFYRLVSEEQRWIGVKEDEVPAETGLGKVRFARPAAKASEAYVTPEEADSCWKKPGPVAGPFMAYPGDGSVVTYYWYRFADQPALLNADLSEQERERLQERVEKIHRNWKKDRTYLTPPSMGKLAEIDPALIVTPPSGMEIGYVPIVTRQGMKE